MNNNSKNTFAQYRMKYLHDTSQIVTPTLEQWLTWSKSTFTLKNTTFQTNNLIESYHNQTKSFYLGRSRNLRVDLLVYLLAKVIVVDYRQDNVKTYLGFPDPKLTIAEEKKKSKAYAINFDDACSMIDKIAENKFVCNSFTTDDTMYVLEIENNCIVSCSCPDVAKICKYIFLLNRITKTPFSLRLSLASSSSSKGDIIDIINIDNSNDDTIRLAEYHDNIQKYYGMFENIFKKKMNEIKENTGNLNKKEEVLKRCVANIGDVGVTSASLPLRQT